MLKFDQQDMVQELSVDEDAREGKSRRPKVVGKDESEKINSPCKLFHAKIIQYKISTLQTSGLLSLSSWLFNIWTYCDSFFV